MAKAKRQAKKKPANKKPATKKKPVAKKPVTKQQPPAAEPSTIEQRAAEMLADYDNGVIDNAFDVIGDAYEIHKELPKSSKLRPAFDRMYRELGEICANVGG